MKETVELFRERFRTLALVEFNPKELVPDEADWQTVRLLIEAADVVDDIFWQQSSSDYDRAELLAQAGGDEELKEIILFNYGPYDRLDNNGALLPVKPKCPAAGFYPPDLTRKEFASNLRTHPNLRAAFESPYTVIRRDNSHLTAIPYHDVYREQVKHLRKLLDKASVSARHLDFKRFLAQRAKDLLKDDYYESDSLWVGLLDNPVDAVIGPYEVYEDTLMNLKAAYEAMILARDFGETEKIRHFQSELPGLCRALEPELGNSLEVEVSRVELSVANLIYTGGDARKAIPAIAFTLPNDERVIEEIGSRQVMLKNVQEAKFNFVTWPISNQIIPSANDRETSARHFFDHTLFHEISHSIGPQRIERDGELTTVNRSLKQYYSVLEEAKADALAACFMLCKSDEKSSRTFLDTYISGFLRPIRFGLNTAHGGANTIQFNFLRQNQALEIDDKTGAIFINPSRARKAIASLTSNILAIQERGDFAAAREFVSTYCTINPEIDQLLHKISSIPIDIRIKYKNVPRKS